MDAVSAEDRDEHLQLRLRRDNPGLGLRARLRRARALQNGPVRGSSDRFRLGRDRRGAAYQSAREKARLQSYWPAQYGLPRRAELRRGGHQGDPKVRSWISPRMFLLFILLRIVRV